MTDSKVLLLLVILVGVAASWDILENGWYPESPLKIKNPEGTFESCRDTSHSGQVTLQAGNITFDGLCVQRHRKFGDGWLVIQQHADRWENFYRNWAHYREGFGRLDKNFWLGLEKIHRLTTAEPHELVVEVVASGRSRYAKYSKFVVGSEAERYELKEVGTYSGTAGDALSKHEGRDFSTFDEDNDFIAEMNCAVEFHGAWWYGGRACIGSDLNRNYDGFAPKMIWEQGPVVQYSRMMIRKIAS